MRTETTASGAVGLGRGGRMSRQRKRDAVLRLLRGEDREILSRALGVTAATLSGWQDSFLDSFLAAGEASLATGPTTGDDLETERLKAKLGEMLLERELLEAKIAALEANRPLARRRARR
jgi:transposase